MHHFAHICFWIGLAGIFISIGMFLQIMLQRTSFLK